MRWARSEYLAASLLLLIAAYLLRGRRWMIWERDLKYWESFRLILVGFMGNNIFPARLGELLRAHCASRKTGNNFGRTASLASIVVERILDGFVIACLGISGLLAVAIDKRLFAPLVFICVLFFLLTGGLIASISFHEGIRRLMDRINKVFPGHLTRYGKEKVMFFLDGLLLIRGFRRIASALFATALIWGIELAAYYLIANAVSHDISLGTCLIFLSVANFASLFPLTVGGIGAVEGAATIYLVGAGIPGSESLAMVLLQHGSQFAFTTAAGMLFYFTGRYYTLPVVRSARDLTPPAAARESAVNVLHSTRDRLDALSTELGIRRKTAKETYLSVVIPAFNERDRLPRTVLEAIAWCKRNVPSYELIISDDGSSDDTPDIARLFSEYDDNIRFFACPHAGKGAAVRMGMLNASGSCVLFMDADGATPLSEIPKLIAKLEEGYPVAIGSRVVQNTDETTVKTAFYRKAIGRTFAAIVNILAVGGIGDTQCGFKMFKKGAVKELFTRQRINGFAFDVELLFLARKLSLSIAEVPVNWVAQKGSKVNLVTDSIKMLKDIFKIRLLHRSI